MEATPLTPHFFKRGAKLCAIGGVWLILLGVLNDRVVDGSARFTTFLFCMAAVGFVLAVANLLFARSRRFANPS